MIELIKQLPDQIEAGLKLPLEAIKPKTSPKTIYICGMGGSAAAGAVASCLFPDTDIRVVRNYALPSYVNENDMVITVSYSGNTEETLSCYKDALAKRAMVQFVSSGGQLVELAGQDGVPGAVIPKGLPPRAALGWLFTPLVLMLLDATSQQPQLKEELTELPDFLRASIKALEGPDSPALDLANKFYNRFPVIYASERFRPVAFRWCAQMNENSKSVAHCASLPEMNHNEVSGLVNPPELVEEMWIVFLRFHEDHPRVSARADITAEILADSVMGITQLEAQGQNTLQRLFWTLVFGDMVSYYLALAYKQDPFAIPRIDVLKSRLRDVPW